jgi:thiol-disulfide isomerase/thioredoxin
VPLRLADLRGRVVLLEFWAFGCIPCLPVLANVGGWYDAYRDDGLTVIGIHHPKIDAERSYDGLVAALDRLGIAYPVAQDNEGLTWRAYGQLVWPTLSLIDKRGNLRYQQVGAGGYEAMETAIRALLAEDA